MYNKINHIEQKMKSCHDGYAGTKTGHGVKESDPMGYEEKVCFVMLEFLPSLFLTILISF